MSVYEVIILACISVFVNILRRSRSLALLATSALVIYWLQPYQEPVNLIFWFPTLILILTSFFWLITSSPEVRGWRENWAAVLILVGVILIVDMNRIFQVEQFFVATTPRIQVVIIVLVVVFVMTLILARFKRFPAFVLWLGVVGLIVALVMLKLPSGLGGLIEKMESIRGKDAGSMTTLSWLGFSYIAFRLMHTVFDRIAGRLPSVTLADFVNYVIFFPAFIAGPIDRIERFSKNLNESAGLNSADWLEAGSRLLFGLFKKFVIADGLAWFTLTEILITEVRTVGWLWFLLYAYSLRIYFDFSGYTDIAIGLGRLMGIRLPENFNLPYLKPNLTQFWNSWHMTLTQWFRSYFFNPLTRTMRSAKKPVPQPLMILLAQTATMILIGLWHGVTSGFLIWGLWHGIGLFIHNRWNEWVRARQPKLRTAPWGAAVLNYTGIFLTFHFVTLGWLFFFLPDPSMAWNVLLRLFGFD